MQDHQRYTQQNRQAWNEIAAVRHKALFPPAKFFAQGGSLLDARVLQTAGQAKSKTVLHLQCATGEETLSWAVAGGVATGVDISERQIEIAQRTARDAGLSVRFIASDVYALPTELQLASFDLVYTGGGALVWLPDLARWAQSVAAALKPGGQFILYETHPLAGCLFVENGVLQIVSDYFARHVPSQESGWSHFQGGESARESKYEFSWPLGDVITALAQAGLRIERLAEYPSAAEWRFGDKLQEVAHLPGEYLLLARKSA